MHDDAGRKRRDTRWCPCSIQALDLFPSREKIQVASFLMANTSSDGNDTLTIATDEPYVTHRENVSTSFIGVADVVNPDTSLITAFFAVWFGLILLTTVVSLIRLAKAARVSRSVRKEDRKRVHDHHRRLESAVSERVGEPGIQIPVVESMRSRNRNASLPPPHPHPPQVPAVTGSPSGIAGPSLTGTMDRRSLSQTSRKHPSATTHSSSHPRPRMQSNQSERGSSFRDVEAQVHNHDKHRPSDRPESV